MKPSSLAPVGLVAALLPLQPVLAQVDVYSTSLHFHGDETTTRMAGESVDLDLWPKSMAVLGADSDNIIGLMNTTSTLCR